MNTAPATTPALQLDSIPGLPNVPIVPCIQNPLERLLGLERCNQVLAKIPADRTGTAFVAAALEQLQIATDAAEADLANIPETGGVMIVANHPYGMLDGLLVLDLIARKRKDVRFMGNDALAAIPQLGDLLLGVDLWNGGKRRNAMALRRSIQWLREGGALVVFPAGRVSAPRLDRAVVMDRPWQPSIGGILRHAGCPALPVHVSGQAGLVTQLGGLLNRHIRLLAQPHQLTSSANRTFQIQVGHPVDAKRLAACKDDRDRSEYLQFRSYLLAERGRTERAPHATDQPEQPIASPRDRSQLIAEIADLSPLCTKGTRDVYVTTGNYSPNILHELGRLRELTFREVGEGTGNALDIDDYDDHCDQLLIWDREDQEIVGAYRLREVNADTDSRELYCHTLYKLKRGFMGQIGHGIELGRSFIQPCYQRQFNSLLLLWQGIGAYVQQRPGATKLFGAVSISAAYSPASRQAIQEVLAHIRTDNPFAEFATPRNPARFTPLRPFQRAALTRWGCSVEELSEWIADLEPNPNLQHIPVLIRQYARLGAVFASFNVDPDFSCAMDGLIVVDLEQTEPRQLRRLFGKTWSLT